MGRIINGDYLFFLLQPAAIHQLITSLCVPHVSGGLMV